MQLDKLTVNIRPIRATHALDLGMAMARAWYGTLFRIAALGLLPVSLAVLMVLGYLVWLEELQSWQMWLAILVLALSRVMVEARLLLFMGQKLFDETFDYQAFQASSKPSWRTLVRLLPRAISTKRHLFLAVCLLEQQAGAALRQRMRVLSRGSEGSLFLFALMFWALEVLLLLGVALIVAFFFFSSDFGQAIFAAIGEFYTAPMWLMVSVVAVYALVVCVLMPFFVAGGFSVYVCRRSLLEAWDVEITFRQLMARYDAQKNSAVLDAQGKR